MVKYEWRKQEKAFYMAKQTPVILDVPAQRFISLHGTGNPNGADFKTKLEALYPAAYGLKAAYRKVAGESAEFEDYVVFPLEGVWSLMAKGQRMDHLDKNEFSYDIMIRVPDFVPEELIQPTIAAVRDKKQLPLIGEIAVQRFEAMQVAQILHVGAYDDEPGSFAKMDELVAAKGLQRISKVHREIYLSDARRVAPERLKTVLRYRVG
ncbi:GyrI-like domain-containing protein [Lactiplantibacillus paraxiangfangensis]|uniref:GyrI-like domain-containing protein n=1 Tax=Lactiplantibacillus paraxiangfangensis TaxID=3076224 RepID=UPI0030C70FB8